jgi:hypothetical protein
MQTSKLFHISPSLLVSEGFVPEVVTYPDLATFDNTRVETYTLTLAHKLTLQVTYFYYAQKPNVFELTESNATLCAGLLDFRTNLHTIAAIKKFTACVKNKLHHV